MMIRWLFSGDDAKGGGASLALVSVPGSGADATGSDAVPSSRAITKAKVVAAKASGVASVPGSGADAKVGVLEAAAGSSAVAKLTPNTPQDSSRRRPF